MTQTNTKIEQTKKKKMIGVAEHHDKILLTFTAAVLVGAFFALDFCGVVWVVVDLPPEETTVGVVEGAGVTQGLDELCEVTLGAGEPG